MTTAQWTAEAAPGVRRALLVELVGLLAVMTSGHVTKSKRGGPRRGAGRKRIWRDNAERQLFYRYRETERGHYNS